MKIYIYTHYELTQGTPISFFFPSPLKLLFFYVSRINIIRIPRLGRFLCFFCLFFNFLFEFFFCSVVIISHCKGTLWLSLSHQPWSAWDRRNIASRASRGSLLTRRRAGDAVGLAVGPALAFALVRAEFAVPVWLSNETVPHIVRHPSALS